jgi:hypothetical protein
MDEKIILKNNIFTNSDTFRLYDRESFFENKKEHVCKHCGIALKID